MACLPFSIDLCSFPRVNALSTCVFDHHVVHWFLYSPIRSKIKWPCVSCSLAHFSCISILSLLHPFKIASIKVLTQINKCIKLLKWYLYQINLINYWCFFSLLLKWNIFDLICEQQFSFLHNLIRKQKSTIIITFNVVIPIFTKNVDISNLFLNQIYYNYLKNVNLCP